MTTMKVMEKRCDQCLFSSNRVVDESRMKALLDRCNQTGQAFECHKATLAEKKAVCRAFFDENASLSVRLAKMLECFEFVKVPNK